ncbi:MAG TPA: CHAP domain-containing protein, partial [Candidatus Saccharimonadaceae bacterium]|nr:CHAP domain-containing protein [Candidatus Saccharimonadaceae bacterium]
QTLNLQTAQKNSLVAKEQQQTQLIAETQDQESAYQQLVSEAQQHLQQVSAQQRAFFANMNSAGVVGDFTYSNWSGNQGCGGGYPYCGAQDSSIDPWGLYNRECVSYVAWSLATRFHRYVANFSGQGNAYQWPESAVEYSGAQVVQNPQPGDAVILPATSNNFAPIGHAMVVEAVNGDSVNVSQYNFGGTGEYSTMTIGTGGVIFLRFPAAN